MENKIMYGVFKEEEHYFGYEGDITTRDMVCVCDTVEEADAYTKKCNKDKPYNEDYYYIIREVPFGVPLITPATQFRIQELIKEADKLGLVTRLKTQEELDQDKLKDDD